MYNVDNSSPGLIAFDWKYEMCNY